MSFSSNSSTLLPGLYIIATPLGNLKDITLRALEVLKGVDIIFCEDTRQSRILMAHYGITTPLKALHEYNETSMIPSLLQAVKQGQRIALISDAGTPLISDPGFKVVRAFQEAGYFVTGLPGPAAVINALIISGMPCHQFFFGGFLPPKSSARHQVLEKFSLLPTTLVFYESPQRLRHTLEDLRIKFQNREVAVVREMTKKFEQVIQGSLSHIIHHFEIHEPRGEMVLVIAPPLEEEVWTEEVLVQALNEALPHQNLKAVAQDLSLVSGWSKRDIYQKALSLKTTSP